MIKQTLFLVAGLMAGAPGIQAQIGLSGLSYDQDFDTLGASGSWADNSTLTGWYASNNDTSAGTVTPFAAFSNSAGGSTTSSVLYSIATSSTDPDRALGGAASSTRYNILGVRLVNDTGSPIDALRVSYDLEQWSDRGTATVTLSYQTFGPGAGSLDQLTGWTVLGSTSSPLPVNASPVSGIGNTTGLVPGISTALGSLGLQDGDELWIRWEITKIAGSNSPHGIDNVAVVVPEPGSLVLLATGLGGLALACVRRNRG